MRIINNILKREKRITLNIISILLCSIGLNLACSYTSRTFSWFSNNVAAIMKVNAVTGDDLLNIDITYATYENSNWKIDKVRVMGEGVNYNPLNPILNPVQIIITPVSGSTISNTGEKIIYFQVDGDLKNYILHINPIRFNGSRAFSLININTRQYQAIPLSYDNNKVINGVLKIKYLNGYLDKQINIQFKEGILKGRSVDAIDKEWYQGKII